MAVRNFIDANREKLKDFPGSLMYLDWAETALEQGADPSDVLYMVMMFNLRGQTIKQHEENNDNENAQRMAA